MKNNMKVLPHPVLLCLVFILACSKQMPTPSSQDTFIQIYEHQGSEAAISIAELNDESLIFGKLSYSTGVGSLVHIERGGKIISNTAIEMGPNEVFVPRLTPDEQGGLLITSSLSSRFTRVNAEGQIVINKRFDLSLNMGNYSKPIFDEHGNAYLGMCSRNFGGNQSIIIKLDAAGKVLQKYTLSLSAFQQTVFEIATISSKNGKILIAGGCKPISWKYSDKQKLFVAEFDEATLQVTNFQLFDEVDNSENDYILDFQVSEKGIAMLCGATPVGDVPALVNSNEFELFFFDAKLKLLKRQRYAPSADDCLPATLFRTQDGGYLISGYVVSGNRSIRNGFFTKVDSEGTLLSSHLLKYQNQYELYSGIETQDGNYVFSGAASSLGLGKESATPCVVKTSTQGAIE